MAEGQEENEQTPDAEEADARPESEGSEDQEARGGQKIMCFISKEMVPINQTVELEFMPGKKVRVMPEFIKYDRGEEEAEL